MMNKTRMTLMATLAAALALLLAPLNSAPAQATRPTAPTAVTWYVNHNATGADTGSGWTDAFTRLQSALEQAQPGDQIWVAQGVYTPTNTADRTAAFNLKAGVVVYGGFAGIESELVQRDWQTHVSVLSGDLGGDDLTEPNGVLTSTAGIIGDNAYHVIVASNLTQTSRLDGFYITGGKADGGYPHFYGGGMYNANGGIQLANVIFSANLATYGGGLYNYFSSPSLFNTTFHANEATADGGGIYSHYSSPSLASVVFFANYAAGYYGGGMYNYFSSPNLVNTIFIANQAAFHGGGMENRSSSPSLVNVTLAYNWATYEGGGIHNYDDEHPTIYNSILWGNSSILNPQIRNGTHTTTMLSFSDVQGGCPAGSTCEHLIDADPLFVRLPLPGADGVWRTADDDPGDLRLPLGSPAIDAGSNALLPDDALDLDGDGNTSEALPLDMRGRPRLGNSAVDLGTYEIYWLCLPLMLR